MQAVEDLRQLLAEQGYLASPTLGMALHLAMTLRRPLLLEGEAGVGKSELARALAATLGTRLIRLQCYEGLDASAAIYEWNYQRQLLTIRAREGSGVPAAIEQHIFSEPFLLRRPLLEAISQDRPPVLLIDEIDRADEAFEAFLLEVLGDFQITVPELGTITAKSIPHVILTANGTRELCDALRRRCLYVHVPFPDAAHEAAIIEARLPGVGAVLSREVAAFVAALRGQDLEKKPGIAEALDFAAALMGLEVGRLATAPDIVQAALVCLLKTEADQDVVTPEVTARLLGRAA